MGIFDKIKGFLNQDISFKVKEASKEINKQPDRSVVVNRYYTEVTETADQGIYGYSTRDEVLQLRNFAEVERFLKDPKVKSSLDTLISGVFASNLEIVSADDSRKAQKLQRYVNKLLSELSGNNGYNTCLEDVLKESLIVALGGYGNFFGEIIPRKCQSGEFKDTWLINEIKSKRPGLLEFITDSYDNISAIHSLINFDEYYPIDRFLLISFNNLFSNPYGTPAFSSVWQYWKAKQIVNKSMQIYINRYGQPVAFAKFENPEHSELASTIANNLFAGANISMPKDVEAGFIEASSKGDNPFLVILDWLDKQISLAICGMDLSQGSGSYASDKVKSEERSLMISEIRRKLEDIINEQIIRRFIAYNFPPDKYPVELYPKAKFIIQKETDKAQYIAMIAGAMQVGAFFPDRLSDVNQARTMIGLPELTEDEFNNMANVEIPSEELTPAEVANMSENFELYRLLEN
jgi:hypothetical protein